MKKIILKKSIIKVLSISMITLFQFIEINCSAHMYPNQPTQMSSNSLFDDAIDSFMDYKNQLYAYLFGTKAKRSSTVASKKSITQKNETTTTELIDNNNENGITQRDIILAAIAQPTELLAPLPTYIHEEKDIITSEQAIKAIRKKFSLIFNPNDQHHVSVHLNDIQKFTPHLDATQHKKMIDAIKFLIENHHRSGLTDLWLWKKANDNLKFRESIPLEAHDAKKKDTEILLILQKKMKLPQPSATRA